MKLNMILDDLPLPRFEIFRTKDKQFCWRFLMKRGKKAEEIARASETYKSKRSMKSGLNKLNDKRFHVIDLT